MWVKLGMEEPVKDEAGNRPERDDEGRERPLEVVDHEFTADFEFEFVDVEVSVENRRALDMILDRLAQPGTMATMAAVNFESSFKTVGKQFLKGIRNADGSGEALEGKACWDFLATKFDWDDVLALFSTMRRHVDMAKSKKKPLKLPSA